MSKVIIEEMADQENKMGEMDALCALLSAVCLCCCVAVCVPLSLVAALLLLATCCGDGDVSRLLTAQRQQT